MDTKDLREDLDKRLTEVKRHLVEVKNKLKENHSQNEELQRVLEQLEKLHDSIVSQYNVIDSMKKDDAGRLPDLEKNIYQSFDSFDEVFSKAGTLMKQMKFSSRKRSVDFKNPLGTK